MWPGILCCFCAVSICVDEPYKHDNSQRLEAFSHWVKINTDVINKKPSHGPDPVAYLAKIQEITSPSVLNVSDPVYLKDAGLAVQSIPPFPAFPQHQPPEFQQLLVLKMAEGVSAIGDPIVAETLARVGLSFLTDTKDYIIWLAGDLASVDEMIRTCKGTWVREN
ncbi:hypothetical protein NE237_017688 [Protea cynaroides]|uniref:Uncharacterized protein n=1 Tax=Protea cynaroides TaxID=273540 RepID=A0A9Q0K8H4_9MAGN|nr:hypothetical protein NE237_017688 [Protea cynaroides]